ncbi:MAG: hypothetical protein L0Y36_10375 [Planctomycetales bacterium]|nr:hypothetical protein [Planctomycetales bacterium]
MNAETPVSKKSDRPRRGLRIVKWILIAAVGFILLIFFGVPLFLSSSGGTNFLLGKVNQSVDGQVKIEDLSIGWFKGIKLVNLSYADNAGQTSVSVRRLETQPSYWALLGGKVKLGRTVIDGPQVYVKIPAMRESSPKAEKPVPVEKPETPPAFPVNQINLELIDGAATVELAGGTSQTVSFTNIASTVNLAAAGQKSMLNVSMNVVGQGEPSTVTAKGEATTGKTGWTLKDAAFDINIDKLQLATLKPLFALAGQSVDIAGELNADASIAIEQNTLKQVRANATITSFAQGTGDQRTVFEKPITITALAGQEGTAVKIEQLRVESEFFNVDCSGTTEAIDYKIDANLAQTQQLIGQFTDLKGLSMAGMLDMGGKVLMKNQEIKATGSGTVKQLIVKKEGISTPTTDVQMDFDCTVDQAKNQLRLASANLTATSLGDVKVANLILPMGDGGDKTISLDAAAKLDLAKAWPFAQVFAELPEGMAIAGILNSVLKVTTTGSVVHLLTENTRIDGLKIIPKEGESFIQEQVTLKSDILLDTEQQTIDIRAFDLQGAAGETLINVTKGQVKKKISNAVTRMNGDFEAQYDWQTLSAFASVYLPEGLSVKGKRKDTFHFDSEYPTEKPELMKANLNAAGAIGFDSASYFGLNFGPTDLKLNIAKGLVDLTIPPTTVNEGKLQFAGTMNLAQEPLLFRLKEPMTILDKVNINDTLSQALLLYTSPIFARAVKTSGTLSFSSQQMVIPLSSQDVMQMTMKGTFGVEALKMQAGDFLGQLLTLLKAGNTATMTIHPTDFTLNKGYLSYEDMQIDIGNNPVNFKGRIGLVDKSLAMDVQLPWTLSGSTVRTGEQASSRVTLPLEGNLTSPKINPGKLIEKQGQQIIEQEIRRGLEGIFK